MELGLRDKVAIVTGGGWGMGKATVLGLADEGVKVFIADLDEGRGNAAVKEVKDKGGEALFVKGDVANWEMVKRAVADTLERFGTNIIKKGLRCLNPMDSIRIYL